MIWVTDSDRQWIKTYHPDLDFCEGSPLILAGNLNFDALYDSQKNACVINPEQEAGSDDRVRIRDTYQIEIQFEPSEYSSWPQVYERGGRIDAIAEKRNKPRIDLHVNPNGAMCLCLKTKEKEHLPNGFKLPDFFHIALIPFFYNQSHYERFRKWAWGGYSHGEIGFLEGYGEINRQADRETAGECINLLRKYPRRPLYEKLLTGSGRVRIYHIPCICGSGRKIGKCHPKAFEGLRKLKEDIKTLGITFD